MSLASELPRVVHAQKAVLAALHEQRESLERSIRQQQAIVDQLAPHLPAAFTHNGGLSAASPAHDELHLAVEHNKMQKSERLSPRAPRPTDRTTACTSTFDRSDSKNSIDSRRGSKMAPSPLPLISPPAPGYPHPFDGSEEPDSPDTPPPEMDFTLPSIPGHSHGSTPGLYGRPSGMNFQTEEDLEKEQARRAERIAYSRAVLNKGNKEGKSLLQDVFECWRDFTWEYGKSRNSRRDPRVPQKRPRKTIVMPNAANAHPLQRRTTEVLGVDGTVDVGGKEHDGELPRFIVAPNSLLRLAVDLCGAAMILYDVLMVPVIMAFLLFEEPIGLQWMTRVFWSCECILSFHTSYFDKHGKLATSRRKIAFHHARTWFVIDILTLTPDWLEWAMLTFGDDAEAQAESFGLMRILRSGRAFRVMRLLRMFKLKKFATSGSELFHDTAEWVQLLLQVTKQSLFVLGIMHLIGCAWFAIGSQAVPLHGHTWERTYFDRLEIEQDRSFSNGDGIFEQYLTSVHWALSQMTPGTVDVVPVNSLERAFNIFVLAISLVVFSSFLSSMTVAVTQLRSIKGLNAKRFTMLRRYMTEQKIPAELQTRVNQFLVERVADLSRGIQEENVELVGLLSDGLQGELRQAALQPKLDRYPLFHRLLTDGDDVSIQVGQRMCRYACRIGTSGPEERIFTAGEIAKGMYLLTHGQFDLLGNARWERADDGLRIGSAETSKIKAGRGRTRLAGGMLKRWDSRGSVDVPRGLSWLMSSGPASPRSNASPAKSFGTSSRNTIMRIGIDLEDEKKRTGLSDLPVTQVNWLCEFALFQPWVHKASLVSVWCAEVVIVDRLAFQECLAQFPDRKKELEQEQARRYERVMRESGGRIGDWAQDNRIEGGGVMRSDTMMLDATSAASRYEAEDEDQ